MVPPEYLARTVAPAMPAGLRVGSPELVGQGSYFLAAARKIHEPRRVFGLHTEQSGSAFDELPQLTERGRPHFPVVGGQ